MLLLLACAYIVIFSHRALVWISPILKAVTDNVEVPMPRGRVWIASGFAVSVIAWAYVFSEILEVLYV
jgi:hypothetical protein